MGTCMVGWAHSRFGRLDGLDLEALIGDVARDAIGHAGIDAGEVGGIWLGQLNGGFVPEIFASSLVLQADDALHGAPVRTDGAGLFRAPCLAAMQLMGEAGEMQVPGAELAGVFNMGGSAVASYVSILERAR